MSPQLTPKQRDLLAQVLAQFADRIGSVAVFGSRASGTAEPCSDIDLVVYGDLDAAAEARLSALFEESDLAVTVDVVTYNNISHEGLRRHIDKAAVELFTQADLRREAARWSTHGAPDPAQRA